MLIIPVLLTVKPSFVCSENDEFANLIKSVAHRMDDSSPVVS